MGCITSIIILIVVLWLAIHLSPFWVLALYEDRKEGPILRTYNWISMLAMAMLFSYGAIKLIELVARINLDIPEEEASMLATTLMICITDYFNGWFSKKDEKNRRNRC